ncbi:MAG: hypothetical protein HY791_13420 [Deltaproteobacteria bacterium]|nr:hypothetical protein [Deltaproteobacteria bacterium]
MAVGRYGPPQLGGDDVVRFVDADHFLREFGQNLRRGRLFVKTKRTFDEGSVVDVRIEGPGVDWVVEATGRVLTSRQGFLGLEVQNFQDDVFPTLDLLADEVERATKQRKARPRDGEATIVGGPLGAPTRTPAPRGGTTLDGPPLVRSREDREGTDEVDALSLGTMSDVQLPAHIRGALEDFARGAKVPVLEATKPPVRRGPDAAPRGPEMEAETPKPERMSRPPPPPRLEDVYAHDAPTKEGPAEGPTQYISIPKKPERPPERRAKGSEEIDETLDVQIPAEIRSMRPNRPPPPAETEQDDATPRPDSDATEGIDDATERPGKPERRIAPSLRRAPPSVADPEEASRARRGAPSESDPSEDAEGAREAEKELDPDEVATGERPQLWSARGQAKPLEPGEIADPLMPLPPSRRSVKKREEPEPDDLPMALPPSRRKEADPVAPSRRNREAEPTRRGDASPSPVGPQPSPISLRPVPRAEPTPEPESEAPMALPPSRRVEARAEPEPEPLMALPPSRKAEPRPESEPMVLPPSRRAPEPDTAPSEPAPPPAPKPESKPAEPPAAPVKPGLEALGSEDLDLITAGLLRATPSGVVRVPNAADLLGLYLAQIRHGTLTCYGGPSGDPGQTVSLKLASGRVLMLSAEIISRVGGWVTMRIADSSPLLELISDSAAEWNKTLSSLGAAVSTPPVVAPVAVAPPPQVAIAPPPPPPPPPPKPPEPKAPPPPAPAPKPAVEESGPPKPPVLAGTIVRFARRLDLEHELKTNVKNGGLSVVSDPLPIREHRTLKFEVAGAETGIRAEVDVVFVGAGKVGFMVGGHVDLCKQIDAWLSSAPAPASAPPAASVLPASAGRPSQPPKPPEPSPAGSDDAFSGSVVPPFELGELLDFPSKRVNSIREGDRLSILTLLDYVARKKMTGVLDIHGKKDESARLWIHQGGIAHAVVEPWSEEVALGRLLVLGKKISEPQLREALDKSKSNRRPVGWQLLQMRALTASALTAQLREQMRLKLEPVYAFRGGRFTWGAWSDPPLKADLVLTNGSGLVSRHVRHRFEQTTTESIEDLLELAMNHPLTQDGAEIDPAIGLNPKEVRYIEMNFDGIKTISEAATGSPLGRLASLRLVAFCLALGIGKVRGGTQIIKRIAVASPSQIDAAGFAALRREMQDSLSFLRSQNYFEIISVHWTAHQRQYRQAYLTVKDKFDPTKGQLRDSPEDIKALAREANELIDKAYAVLMNKDERAKYRRQNWDTSSRKAAADMLVKQAELNLMRGDRMGGIEMLETACEIAPTPDYQMLLQRAREGRDL